MSTCRGSAWMPTATSRPRAPSAATARSRPAWVPDTSNVTAAPAPSDHVSSKAGRPAAPESSTSRPSSSTTERRNGSGSTRSAFAPRARATTAISTPMGPPPTTRTRSPADSPARATSWWATATGSTSAAARSGRSGGSGTRSSCGTFQSCCIAPVESMPTKSRRSQMWACPARQVGHRPHQRSGITVTGSPADQPVTPSPDDCHTSGHLVPDHAVVGRPGRPCARPGCAGRCRRSRRRPPRAAPRPVREEVRRPPRPRCRAPRRTARPAFSGHHPVRQYPSTARTVRR